MTLENRYRIDYRDTVRGKLYGREVRISRRVHTGSMWVWRSVGFGFAAMPELALKRAVRDVRMARKLGHFAPGMTELDIATRAK